MNLRIARIRKSPQRFVDSARRQSGLTILEVLIALAVLSIGLAGLAIMHMSSLKYVHSAYYRSLASAIALNFEERLWLEFADNTVDCPDITTSGGAYTNLDSDWTRANVGGDWAWSNSKLATIRALTVSVADITAAPPFVEVPVTLTWTDQRFDDADSVVDESDIDEEYVYTIRILCKSGNSGAIAAP